MAGVEIEAGGNEGDFWIVKSPSLIGIAILVLFLAVLLLVVPGKDLQSADTKEAGPAHGRLVETSSSIAKAELQPVKTSRRLKKAEHDVGSLFESHPGEIGFVVVEEAALEDVLQEQGLPLKGWDGYVINREVLQNAIQQRGGQAGSGRICADLIAGDDNQGGESFILKMKNINAEGSVSELEDGTFRISLTCLFSTGPSNETQKLETVFRIPSGAGYLFLSEFPDNSGQALVVISPSPTVGSILP